MSGEEDPGIGLVEDAGIGLSLLQPPIDFIFSDAYMIGAVQFELARRMVRAMLKRQKASDSEKLEMMEIYSRWKKEA